MGARIPNYNKGNKKVRSIEQEGQYLLVCDESGVIMAYDFTLDVLIYCARVGGKYTEVSLPDGFNFMADCATLFGAEGIRRNNFTRR